MDCFSWGGGWPDTFKILLGRSLFLQDGEEHRRNRKLMMPAFHGAALARYFDTMESIALSYFQRWEKKEELVWFEGMKQLTFDIASQLLVGADSGEDVAYLSSLFTTLTSGLFSLFPVQWKWTKFGKAVTARDRLLEHLSQVVRQRQERPTQDVLSLLVQTRDEAGVGFTHVRTHRPGDATPICRTRNHHRHVDVVVSGIGSPPRNLTTSARRTAKNWRSRDLCAWNNSPKCPNLDRILLEVERLHPPVGGGFRRVVKPFEFNGYEVPAGWLAVYSILATHRLEEIYPEPERFDPDRFLPERLDKGKPKPFSLIGFGGGPRVCVGLAFAKLEMKIVAAHLLRGYQWELLPNQSLEAVQVPTRHPKDGLQVRFAKL